MCDDDIDIQISEKVERLMSHLDRLLVEGSISQDDYTKALKDLHIWVESKRPKVTK